MRRMWIPHSAAQHRGHHDGRRLETHAQRRRVVQGKDCPRRLIPSPVTPTLNGHHCRQRGGRRRVRYDVMCDGGRLVRVGGDDIGGVFVEWLQSVGFRYVHDRCPAGEYPDHNLYGSGGLCLPNGCGTGQRCPCHIQRQSWGMDVQHVEHSGRGRCAAGDHGLTESQHGPHERSAACRCHGGCPHAHRGHRSP